MNRFVNLINMLNQQSDIFNRSFTNTKKMSFKSPEKYIRGGSIEKNE